MKCSKLVTLEENVIRVQQLPFMPFVAFLHSPLRFLTVTIEKTVSAKLFLKMQFLKNAFSIRLQ